MATTDKNGREIMPGDTLKMFHFLGPRLKKYYMYKFVKRIVKGNLFEISHLNLAGETFTMQIDGKQHDNIEIVQGFGADGTHFEERPRL